MNTKKTVPVSVIIPCYLCANTVERALKSVLSQTVMPEEIILVNDASPDGGKTLFELEELAKRYRNTICIKVIDLEKNFGPSNARNQGWDVAKYTYIAFLDADDSWHPRKLEIQLKSLEKNPNVALLGHQRCFIGSTQGFFDKDAEGWVVTPIALAFSNRFPTSSVIIRRDIPFRFEKGKRYSEDYLLWLKIVFSGYKALKLELPLAYCYKSDYGEDGLTADLWKMERGEIDTYYRLAKEGYISFLALVFFLGISIVKYIKRIFMVRIRKFTGWR